MSPPEPATEGPGEVAPPSTEDEAGVDLSRQRLLELLEQGRGPTPAPGVDDHDVHGVPNTATGAAGSGGAAGGAAGGGAGVGGARAFRTQPYFPDLETWVTRFFAPVFVRRETPLFKWCAQWWRHPEAVVRLEALWRSWEVLRLDPGTGGGVWLREYLDVQLVSLTSSAGPFTDCSAGRHEAAPTTLPLEPVPAGWWPVPPP